MSEQVSPAEINGDSSRRDLEVRAPDLDGVVSGLAESQLNLPALEAAVVREALKRCGGNQVQAARLLGISRTSIRSRIRRLGLEAEVF